MTHRRRGRILCEARVIRGRCSVRFSSRSRNLSGNGSGESGRGGGGAGFNECAVAWGSAVRLLFTYVSQLDFICCIILATLVITHLQRLYFVVRFSA
jgi:hypothetical protein